MRSAKAIKALVGTTALATALGVGSMIPQAAAVNRTVAGQNNSAGDKDPNLHKALRALKRAQAFLTAADHDSAGHREKALDLVQQAIDQDQQAIADDK